MPSINIIAILYRLFIRRFLLVLIYQIVLIVLYRAFFGRDDESWETDSRGNKIYLSFNPNRNYFYFNGYGNLVSCDYKDYSDKLDDYFIEQLAKHRQYIYAIDDDIELSELFDKLEQEESDE